MVYFLSNHLKYLLDIHNKYGDSKKTIHISVVSWGGPSNPPVLLVHGYMDSAATFILLVDQLPDTFYYVSFDMPGKIYISY